MGQSGLLPQKNCVSSLGEGIGKLYSNDSEKA